MTENAGDNTETGCLKSQNLQWSWASIHGTSTA